MLYSPSAWASGAKSHLHHSSVFPQSETEHESNDRGLIYACELWRAFKFCRVSRTFFFIIFFFAHVHRGSVHPPAREGPQAAAEWDEGLFFSHRLPLFPPEGCYKSGFTQQHGVKPGCPRSPPVCAKAPNTGSCSATWTTTCHSKWLQRKEAFQEKNRKKKKEYRWLKGQEVRGWLSSSSSLHGCVSKRMQKGGLASYYLLILVFDG